MSHDAIVPSNLPPPFGPYSPAIKVGQFIFTSGQLPLDPKTGQMIDGTIEAQARQTLQNLQTVLEAAGAGLEHVVKTTVFLKAMSDFATVNRVYASYFTATPAPARSCVAVAELPKNALIEIEAMAILPA